MLFRIFLRIPENIKYRRGDRSVVRCIVKWIFYDETTVWINSNLQACPQTFHLYVVKTQYITRCFSELLQMLTDRNNKFGYLLTHRAYPVRFSSSVNWFRPEKSDQFSWWIDIATTRCFWIEIFDFLQHAPHSIHSRQSIASKSICPVLVTTIIFVFRNGHHPTHHCGAQHRQRLNCTPPPTHHPECYLPRSLLSRWVCAGLQPWWVSVYMDGPIENW